MLKPTFVIGATQNVSESREKAICILQKLFRMIQ